MAAPSSRARSAALGPAISPSRSLSATASDLSSSPTLRFTIDGRATSPRRGLASVKRPVAGAPTAGRRRTCTCSPTTHPGSFRCGLHKGKQQRSSSSSRFNTRRSAMTNSLARIGTVEGDWVKRALVALIRPCAHQQLRRGVFQVLPSRLSVMSIAGGEV